MKKNKSQNNKSQRNVSFFIGSLTILLFIVLVGVSYMYLKSERDKTKFKEQFADIITSVQKLNQSSENMLKGSVDMGLKDIKSTVSKIDTFSKDYLTKTKGLTAEQEQLSGKIISDWGKLKSNLNSLISFESTIKAVNSAKKLINTSKVQIRQLTKDIIEKLDVFQDTHNLKIALSSLNNSVEKLSVALTGLSEAKGELGSDIGKEIKSYLEYSNRVVSEYEKLGAIAFSAGDKDGFKKMGLLLNDHIKVITPLVSQLPKEIKEVSKLKLAINSQNKIIPAMNAKLTDFSSKKDANVLGPIPNIPVGYPPIILVLLVAIVLLSAYWVFLKNKISNALRKEAEKLRDEAEKRNEMTKSSVNRLMLVLEELSDGDLTVEAEISNDSSAESIGDFVNNVVESMREMVGTIADTSNQVTEITDKTADISGFLADSSLEQSKKINASREITENMATSLAGVANYTELSVEIARSSFDIANKGRALVQSTIKGMNGIRENIQDTSKRIKHLGESSQEISNIVEMIKSIADQTNILALNAAIQATSAGEAGKGFAVVADEVQRLAERSTNATKKIDSLVKTIQLDVNEAGASMEESIREVVLGSEVAEKAGGSLDKIEEASKNMASLIVNISNVIKAESETAVQVSNDMEDITALNKKTVDDVISSVNSVKVLQKLAVTLKDSISDFTLPDEEEDSLI